MADEEEICTLNEEQLKFLETCEQEFADRYTDKDADYKSTKERGIGKPPIVEPWYNKPRRAFDYTNRNKGGDRNYRHRERYNSHQGGGSRYSDSYKERRYDGTYRHPNSRSSHRNNPY